MGKAKHRSDQRAATRGGGFTGLPHVVQDSPAYLSLDFYARAVLFEVLRRFNGYNNGKIAISQRELGERLNSSNYRKIGKAVADLMDWGLIDVKTDGNWKARMAREYRLTFVSTGDYQRHVAATEDYRNWSAPRKSGADDVSSESAISADDASSERHFTADDASSSRSQKWRKIVNSKNAAADHVSSLIGKPYPPAEIGVSVWWKADRELHLKGWADCIFIVASRPEMAVAA